MNRKLGRYCKRVIAFLSAFVVFFAGIYLTSFSSEAANVAYNSVYAEPELDGNSGYLLTHCSYADGTPYLTIYYWKITPISSSVNTAMDLIISSNNISFTPRVYGLNNTVGEGYCSVYRMDENGSITRIHNGLFTASANFNYAISIPHASSMYGNYGSVANTVHGNSVPSVTVTWGGQINNYNLIADVYNSVMNIYHQSVGTNARLDEMIRQLNALTSEIDNVEETLNSMYSLMSQYYDSFDSHLQNIYNRLGEQLDEQKKSNTWLEKIYNKIVEALGLQGEESTEKLPDEEVDSVLEEEDKLMQDTTDAENSLDFSVDSNSNNVVWNVIERVLNANSRVFGAFIGIMTLGVITLLLNR